MSAMQSRRSRKACTASRSSLSLERLESRLALAGNVTAQLLGSTLLLTGDALDNSLVVATAAGGKMAVISAPGTTINGADATVAPFVTSRAVTNIIARLNGGDDVIGFGNDAAGLVRQLGISGIVSPPFNEADLQTAIGQVAPGVTTFFLPGSLTVTTGAGDDAVGICGTVGGFVVANLGTASSSQGNAIAIGDPLDSTVSSRVGGSFSVVGGDGNDRIFFTGTDVGGGMAADLGNGVNETFVRGTDSTAAATIGSFAYSGGTGGEEIALGGNLTVRKDVSVFTGPLGADRIGVFGGVNIGGRVIIDTGTSGGHDSVRLMPATIKRSLSVTTGAGNDEIEVRWSEVGGGLAIDSGAGDDAITLSSSTVGFNTVIDTGPGNDVVSTNSLATRHNLFAYLGQGNDTLTLENAAAFAAFLYGGPGTNSLTTNAATRAGIRTLKYFQFQTRNRF